jgi:hypothetical protein
MLDAATDAPADAAPDVVADVHVDAGPLRLRSGGLGTVGPARLQSGTSRIGDDGFETGPRLCAGSVCVTGALGP